MGEVDVFGDAAQEVDREGQVEEDGLPEGAEAHYEQQVAPVLVSHDLGKVCYGKLEPSESAIHGHNADDGGQDDRVVGCHEIAAYEHNFE